MTEEEAHQLLGLYPRRRAPAARRIVLPFSLPPYRVSPRLSLQLPRVPALTPYFSLPYPPEICQSFPPKTKRLIMSQKSITRVGPASTAQSSRTATPRHATPSRRRVLARTATRSGEGAGQCRRRCTVR